VASKSEDGGIRGVVGRGKLVGDGKKEEGENDRKEYRRCEKKARRLHPPVQAVILDDLGEECGGKKWRVTGHGPEKLPTLRIIPLGDAHGPWPRDGARSYESPRGSCAGSWMPGKNAVRYTDSGTGT